MYNLTPIRPLPPVRKSYDSFWEKVNKTDTHWLWTGRVKTSGYGVYSGWHGTFYSSNHAAHRVAYEILVGPIPENFTVDHLCRIRLCVNPECLEAVTNAENTARMILHSRGIKITRGMDALSIVERDKKFKTSEKILEKNRLYRQKRKEGGYPVRGGWRHG